VIDTVDWHCTALFCHSVVLAVLVDIIRLIFYLIFCGLPRKHVFDGVDIGATW